MLNKCVHVYVSSCFHMFKNIPDLQRSNLSFALSFFILYSKDMEFVLVNYFMQFRPIRKGPSFLGYYYAKLVPWIVAVYFHVDFFLGGSEFSLKIHILLGRHALKNKSSFLLFVVPKFQIFIINHISYALHTSILRFSL